MTTRPRVVVLRGHHANIGELRPWELLRDRYEIEVVTTARADQRLEGLDVPWTTARTRRRGPARTARDTGDSSDRRCVPRRGVAVRGAAIVHTAELGPWFAAQPARLRREHRFRLVTTVWETIPFRATFALHGRRRTAVPCSRDGSLSADDGARPSVPAARGSGR